MEKLMFAQLFKVDEAKREVWGIATEQTPDADGEVFNYDASKPYFQAWSQNAYDTSGGKSRGNIREMHQLEAVGKVIDIQYDDASKRITIGAKIVSDSTWQKVVEGVLTGFSIGGKVLEFVKNAYTCKPIEISVVDLPCLPTAVFQLIKADGSAVSRTFKKEAQALRITKPTEAQKAQFSKILGQTLTKAMTSGGITKSLGNISELTSILSQMRWVLMDTKWEAEYEGEGGDPRDAALAIELEDIMVRIVNALKSMVDEETAELFGKAAKGGDMSWEVIQKKAKSKADYFRKSADNHATMADCHKDMGLEMAAMADFHKSMMTTCKADDDGSKATRDFHKGMMASCKAMATNCDKAAKAHTAQADTHGKMADGADSEEKAALAEIQKAAVAAEGDDMFTTEELKKAVADGMVEAFKAQHVAKAAADKEAADKAAADKAAAKPVEIDAEVLKAAVVAEVTKSMETQALTKAQTESIATLVTESVTKAITALDIPKMIEAKAEEVAKAFKTAPAPVPADFRLIPRAAGETVTKTATISDDDAGL